MGSEHRGIPPKLALDLRDKFGLQLFVETGTLVGNTAKWAAEHFRQVYTIECSYKFYILALNKLDEISNVQLIYGFSQDVLAPFLTNITEPALFWLDAHWSKDLGYNNFQKVLCPVLAEIEAIAESDQGHVILVDDFRLFGEQPGWPTKDLVKRELQRLDKIVTYSADVFVAVPNGKD